MSEDTDFELPQCAFSPLPAAGNADEVEIIDLCSPMKVTPEDNVDDDEVLLLTSSSAAAAAAAAVKGPAKKSVEKVKKSAKSTKEKVPKSNKWKYRLKLARTANGDEVPCGVCHAPLRAGNSSNGATFGQPFLTCVVCDNFVVKRSDPAAVPTKVEDQTV